MLYGRIHVDFNLAKPEDQRLYQFAERLKAGRELAAFFKKHLKSELERCGEEDLHAGGHTTEIRDIPTRQD